MRRLRRRSLATSRSSARRNLRNQVAQVAAVAALAHRLRNQVAWLRVGCGLMEWLRGCVVAWLRPGAATARVAEHRLRGCGGCAMVAQWGRTA